MNCQEFERLLQPLVAGDLAASEAERCHRHAGECPSCRDVLNLAGIAEATEIPPDFVPAVMADTSGPSCAAAEPHLSEYLAERLAPTTNRLVQSHLDGCSSCRSLMPVLSALAVDLPRLAEIQPDRRFYAEVLAATLPWRTRAGRWWAQVWPRWVARPRFALEAAYSLTLVLILLVSFPGSPLQAMPQRAAEIARSVPVDHVGGQLEQIEVQAARGLEGLKESKGAQAVVGSWRRTIELGTAASRRAYELASDAPDWAGEQLRTFWSWLASLLERDGAESVDSEPEEEKP